MTWKPLIEALLALAGPHAMPDGEVTVEVVSQAERPWASVTFSGTRHTVQLAFVNGVAQARAEAFIARLPEHEFTLAGQLVADAAVTGVERDFAAGRVTVTTDVLLLDDD